MPPGGTREFRKDDADSADFRPGEGSRLLRELSGLHNRLGTPVRTWTPAVYAGIARRMRPAPVRARWRRQCGRRDTYRDNKPRRVPRRADGEAVRVCTPGDRAHAVG